LKAGHALNFYADTGPPVRIRPRFPRRRRRERKAEKKENIGGGGAAPGERHPPTPWSIDRVLVEEDAPEGAEGHDRRRRPPEAQVVVGDPHHHHDGDVHHRGQGLDGAAPVHKAAPNLRHEGQCSHHRPQGQHKVVPSQRRLFLFGLQSCFLFSFYGLIWLIIVFLSQHIGSKDLPTSMYQLDLFFYGYSKATMAIHGNGPCIAFK